MYTLTKISVCQHITVSQSFIKRAEAISSAEGCVEGRKDLGEKRDLFCMSGMVGGG